MSKTQRVIVKEIIKRTHLGKPALEIRVVDSSSKLNVKELKQLSKNNLGEMYITDLKK